MLSYPSIEIISNDKFLVSLPDIVLSPPVSKEKSNINIFFS